MLKEFRRNVGLGEDVEEEDEEPEAWNRKVILTGLIDFLEGSL